MNVFGLKRCYFLLNEHIFINFGRQNATIQTSKGTMPQNNY